jgi:hypothetical protein
MKSPLLIIAPVLGVGDSGKMGICPAVIISMINKSNRAIVPANGIAIITALFHTIF